MLSKTFYQISIHALRKESDQDGAHNVKQAKEFQSTLSVRRATQMDGAIVRLVVISIHALRKESDLRSATELPKLDIFQSTLSVRRATQAV